MTREQEPAGRKVTARAAALILAERDPVIARLVADPGLPRLPRPDGSYFKLLVRAITFQRLARAPSTTGQWRPWTARSRPAA
jgi:hypothetical protein